MTQKCKTRTFVYKKIKNLLTQTHVCNKMKSRKGDNMKFLKNNKGAIIFYLIILIATLVISNDVKNDNLREENRYVMVNLPN